MFKKFFIVVLLAIVVLASFVLIQTWRFTKPIPHTKALAIPGLSDSSVIHLSKALQIKTISAGYNVSVDTTAFAQFRTFLETTYPLIHQKLQRTIINEFSYIYKWQGKNTSLKPNILMAHEDVVPVEKATEKLWHVGPFSGTITDSAVLGRGAIDDKGSLISIMEAVEKLLQENYQPERTIYLCFGHTEEGGGENGAPAIVNWLQQNNIRASMVLDEGGIITRENFKELQRPIALIGVTEKGYGTFELSVIKEGGHSSMPSKETAVDILAKALVNIRKQQMPVHITTPTNTMLQTIGPGLDFTTRMALANRWLFEPMLVSQFEKGNATSASIHTTIVPTIVNSGVKENVIPTEATATINCRIIPGETPADVEAFLKKQINDERVAVKKIFGSEASKITGTETEAYKKVAAVTYKVFDDVVPVPFLMIGATDSKFYEKVADGVLKFCPCTDPQGFHGIDERIKLDDFKKMIFFYQLVIKE
ncbi:MAG: M20 family peptidase [Bacteroidota bacterium]